MPTLDQRLTALEAQTPARKASASDMHAWCAANRIDTPAPTNGETVPEWLSRVSGEALEAMMHLSGPDPEHGGHWPDPATPM